MRDVLTLKNLTALSSGGKLDNREVIIRYLTSEEGEVVLSELQEKLLKRWTFADDQMRANRLKAGDVLRLVMKKFHISLATAKRDIYDASFVFATNASPDKKYLLAIHADFLKDAMRQCLDDKNFAGLASLSREYISALNSMPVDQGDARNAPMPVFAIFAKDITVLMEGGIDAEQAARIAQETLEKQGMTFDLKEEDYHVE